MGELVDFDARLSSDPDGTIGAYFWSFGNGNGASGSPLAGAAYDAPGIYAVRLVVVDNHGAQSEATTEVVVRPAEPAPAAPKPPPSVDMTAPVVRAVTSGGRRAALVRLRFVVADGGGWARIEALVRSRDGRTITLRAEERVDGGSRTIGWRAPRGFSASSFCVRATDRAENVSAWSCAALRLR